MSGARINRKATKDQPAQPGDLQDGVLIVRFQFTRMIGAGGMGEAKSDDLPGMRFAVKIVSLEHVRNHDVVIRFFGEARAASAIDDPDIVVIHGTGRTEDGRPALVMQYIEGVSLADMCEERGPLPIDAAGKILLQSASALRAAHSHNITHRDIKPQNIMVVRARWGREWFVIVVDFGIAKFTIGNSGGARGRVPSGAAWTARRFASGAWRHGGEPSLRGRLAAVRRSRCDASRSTEQRAREPHHESRSKRTSWGTQCL